MYYIEHIILYCLKQLNGERTIYSILHLLNGKKSSQTIQDAHLFSLKRFFKMYEHVTRDTFETIVKSMDERQWIYSCGNGQYLVTSLGEAMLAGHVLPQYFNGWDYSQSASLFWERFSLFIQVVSNITFANTKYTAIQKDREVQLWLKSVLQEISLPKSKIGPSVYNEIKTCLEGDIGLNPFILIYRLTGSNQIGLTSHQTAMKLKMNHLDYDLEFWNIIHFLIETVQRDQERFYLLSFILPAFSPFVSITNSTRKTLDLLSTGLTLDEIAAVRNLKISTIEDHIVELTLNLGDFSIDRYVDPELQQKIKEVSELEATRQLKVIKRKLQVASYFQIRLCLAKGGFL